MRVAGFEPTTSGISGRHLYRLGYTRNSWPLPHLHMAALQTGGPGRTRTSNPRLRKPALSSIELRNHKRCGARGGIRTCTVLILNEPPPANWATRAYPHPDSNRKPRGFKARRSTCWRMRAFPAAMLIGIADQAYWRPWRESNPRPAARQAAALTTELQDHAETGAPGWIRTSNLRHLRPSPLPIGLQGLAPAPGFEPGFAVLETIVLTIAPHR